MMFLYEIIKPLCTVRYCSKRSDKQIEVLTKLYDWQISGVEMLFRDQASN